MGIVKADRRHPRNLNTTGGIVCVVVAICGLFFMVAGLGITHDEWVDAGRTDALRTHGITTQAIVLSVSYDPDGGDPNGWTALGVRFRDAAGRQRLATMGHHGPPDEHVGRPIPVIYDSTDPALIDLVGDRQYMVASNDGLILGVGICVGGAVVAASCGVAALKRKRTPVPGWYLDPWCGTAWRFWDGRDWTGFVSTRIVN